MITGIEIDSGSSDGSSAIPNSAADRAFLAQARDEEWAAWCEADVMRRIWGICTWSHTEIEEIACRSTLCRVTVNMPSPSVLASLYTNIALSHLYGDGVTGAEWNELPAPARRYRAVFYLAYAAPIVVGRLAVGTGSDALVSEADADEPRLDSLEARAPRATIPRLESASTAALSAIPSIKSTANLSTIPSIKSTASLSTIPSIKSTASLPTTPRTIPSITSTASLPTTPRTIPSIKSTASLPTTPRMIPSIKSTASLPTTPRITSTASLSTIPSIKSTASLSTIPSIKSTASLSSIPRITSTASRSTIPSTTSTASLSTIPSIKSTASLSTIPSITSTASLSTIPSSESTASLSTIPSITSTTNLSTIPRITSTASLSTIPSTTSTASRPTIRSITSTANSASAPNPDPTTTALGTSSSIDPPARAPDRDLESTTPARAPDRDRESTTPALATSLETDSTAAAAAALASNPEIVSLRVSHLAGIDRAGAPRPLAHVISRRAQTSQPLRSASSMSPIALAADATGPVAMRVAIGSTSHAIPASVSRAERTEPSELDAAADLTDAVELEADDPDPTASYPRALLEASDVEEVADATAQYPRELLDIAEFDRAEQIEDVFDEMSARLDALALPAIPSGPASSPFAAPLRSRAELRALGTGKHVIVRPRSLTPVSAAAVSRAAEQIDIVELTSSITRPVR